MWDGMNTHQVIELSKCHLSTDVLSHGDKGDGNNSECLESVIFLGLILLAFFAFISVGVLVAVVEH